jgi:hypothetical protein
LQVAGLAHVDFSHKPPRGKSAINGTYPNFSDATAIFDEIHSLFVTSALAPSFQCVHDCPSKSSQSSEKSEKKDIPAKYQAQLFYFTDFSC